MDKEKIIKGIKLVPKQLIVYGNGDNFPSTFKWFETNKPGGWSVHVSISFNMKGEVKTKFLVSPPLYLRGKERERLKFKTNSYVELKKWLKKYKSLIEEETIQSISEI